MEMNNHKINWRNYLNAAWRSALAYGLGLLAGDLLSFILFKIAPSLRKMDFETPISTLLFGFIMAFIIIGVGSGIGGFLGGRSLPVVRERHTQRAYAWRSAISMALLYGPLVFLAMFTTSLFSYYYVMETPVRKYIFLFMVIGAIFGGLFGLLFGIITLRWRGLGWAIMASSAGFAIGGLGLGSGMYLYLQSIISGELGSGAWWWILVGLLWFGAAGGAGLGLIYYRLSLVEQQEVTGRNWLAYIGCAGMIVVALFVVFLLRQILNVASDYMTPQKANLSPVLSSDVKGTHWGDITNVSNLKDAPAGGIEPQITANENGEIAIILTSPENELHYFPAGWDDDAKATVISNPVTIPTEITPTSPARAVIDGEGITHIVWRTGTDIRYSTCEEGACSMPVPLPDGNDLVCVGTSSFLADVGELAGVSPAIAASGRGTIMVSWLHESGMQLYTTWESGLSSEEIDPEVNCVSETQTGLAEQTQLAGSSQDDFVMVFQINGGISTIAYRSGDWSVVQAIGKGEYPQVYMDTDDKVHFAWCNENGTVSYLSGDSESAASSMPCLSRPELGMDENFEMHIIWASDEVLDVNGNPRDEAVIYESILSGDEWSQPMIVSSTDGIIQPSLSSAPGGVLHAVWSAGSAAISPLLLTAQIQYSCDGADLTGFSETLYNVGSSKKYRDPDSIVPFCGNQYNRLLFTPFPMPEFSDEEAKPHGGFDDYVDMMLDAEYEVLLATMEYDEDKNEDSPGAVFSRGIVELYNKVAENPENYPRGMNVKIVLGNPPRVEMNTDLWRVLTDIRNAGLPEMVNEEIGWKLEIANFEGHMPHSHVKVFVVDGKTAVSTGFNFQYHHFPTDHPSRAGEGTLDMGIQITGPAVQEVRMVFDELWEGAVQRHCSNLYAPYPLWQWQCRDSAAVPDHLPEVSRYYIAEGDAQVYSMLRNEVLELSDDQIRDVIEQAEESVDVIEAMFAMPLVCYLNHLYDLCGPEQAMPYVQSIIKAAENGAHVRLLLKMTPFMGTEAAISVEVIEEALREAGIEDRVEFRAFPIALHAKTFSVDNELVVVGSQNFHYTAYGENTGLVEHNLGVIDPQAVEDWQRVFDYYWDLAGE